MKGYIFEEELKRSFEHWKKQGWDFSWWKVVDVNSYHYGTIYCQNCGEKNENPLIAPEALGDFILFGDRTAAVVEAKSTGKEFFPLRNIKDSQISSGLIINSYESVNYYFALNDRRKHRLFFISAYDLDDLIAETRLKTKLPWNEIASRSTTVVVGMKGGKWDVRPILKKICSYNGREEGRRTAEKNEGGIIRAELPHSDSAQSPILIRTLTDIPPFILGDGSTCRLKKGNVANLPLLFAQILLREGVAEALTECPFPLDKSDKKG